MANTQKLIMPKEPAEQRRLRAERIATVLAGLSTEKAWSVEIKPHKPTRSGEQNRYLWSIYGFILDAGGEDLGGWTKDDLHEFFLMEHFGHEVKRIFGRKRLVPLRRSSKLNKQEFTDFIETIARFMAERGVYVPTPQDDEAWHVEAA